MNARKAQRMAKQAKERQRIIRKADEAERHAVRKLQERDAKNLVPKMLESVFDHIETDADLGHMETCMFFEYTCINGLALRAVMERLSGDGFTVVKKPIWKPFHMNKETPAQHYELLIQWRIVR